MRHADWGRYALLVVILGVAARVAGGDANGQTKEIGGNSHGAVSGRVIGPGGDSLSGVQVNLTSVTGVGLMVSVSNERGEFTFTEVLPGLYTLSAFKGAYVYANFANATQEDSVVLRVEAKSVLKDIDLRLEKGGVITGKITEENREPVVLASVSVIDLDSGGSHPLHVNLPPAMTDDRGVFRLFGLPSGRYVVKATFRRQVGGSQEEHVTAYYPGTGLQSEAQPVEVAAGGEDDRLKGGVAIVIMPVLREE